MPEELPEIKQTHDYEAVREEEATVPEADKQEPKKAKTDPEKEVTQEGTSGDSYEGKNQIG